MTQRGFEATTFEEEKRRCLELAAVAMHDSYEAETLWEEFDDSSEELRSDREAALAALGAGARVLDRCSDALRDDPGVVLVAVLAWAGDYWSASEAQRSDLKIILAYFRRLSWDLRSEFPPIWPFWHGLEETFPHEVREDKDMALQVFRGIPVYRLARPWYDQLAENVKSVIPYQRFDQASWSALALAGDEAPVLSVTLSRGPQEDAGSGHSFHVEAALLSGTTITCQFPDQTTTDRWGTERPGPILDNLAMKLVEELPKDSQAEAAPQHVFITFPKEDGDHVVVSVWDFDRPLSDFLFADESESEPTQTTPASP